MSQATAAYQASQIKVLEGLEPVRKRPGMYIGSTDSKGLHHLAREILDNAVDEAIAGFGHTIQMFHNPTPESYLQIVPNKKEVMGSEEIIIVDNGRGIPVDMHSSGVSALEVVLTKLHAGGKFEETAYQASGGLHGVGSSAVNALSAIMQVVVKRDNKYHYLALSQGEILDHVKVISTEKFQELFPVASQALINKYETGTLVSFVPDTSIFSTTKFSTNELVSILKDRAYLMARIYFELNDTVAHINRHYYFENGIRSLVEHINRSKKPMHQVFYVNKAWSDEETHKHIGVEVSLQYNDSYSERLESYVNVIPTPDGGTHVTGFRAALLKVLKDYADKNKLLKEKENFTSEDLKEGLTAVVFVKMPANDLQFEGQTKSRLNTSEAHTAVYQIVKDALTDFLEENPKDAKAIISKIVLTANARMAARAAKDAVIRKNAFEGGGLPGKLADCQSRNAEECEIYIVEGDSAGGSAKQGRDRKFQAIFPLRGKILNTERARLHKVVETEELKNLIIALGAGIGETFKPEKLRYHRIILMTDADVDGEHITTLGLTFFYRHLPEIIKGGYLYVAMPPLFKVTDGKTVNYVYTEAERDQAIAKIKAKKPNATINVQRYKGLGEMNAEQLWETTMNPANRMLKRITLDDVEQMNNTFSVLMGDEVIPRRRFIQSHARLANLDI
ncbi:DNA gyrase subunit B [bacterium]|nr:DNA gyrase subunit B [bacterium]